MDLDNDEMFEVGNYMYFFELDFFENMLFLFLEYNGMGYVIYYCYVEIGCWYVYSFDIVKIKWFDVYRLFSLKMILDFLVSVFVI